MFFQESVTDASATDIKTKEKADDAIGPGGERRDAAGGAGGEAEVGGAAADETGISRTGSARCE